MTQKIRIEHHPALRIERDRLRRRKEACEEILPRSIRQRNLRNLFSELVHFGRGKHRDVTTRMAGRQKHVPIRVCGPPQRRNRDTILVVERMPEQAGVKRCARDRHGGSDSCPPLRHIYPHFLPLWSRKESCVYGVFTDTIFTGRKRLTESLSSSLITGLKALFIYCLSIYYDTMKFQTPSSYSASDFYTFLSSSQNESQDLLQISENAVHFRQPSQLIGRGSPFAALLGVVLTCSRISHFALGGTQP